MADGSITSRPYLGLPPNTADDRERARELYKYFRPPDKTEPIDTVLTAHSQLAAWRLNAERAMVSLIDEETQYFVAESTKTVHLDDAEKYENPEDAIWAGCVRVPKVGRLCEHTISTPPPPDGGPACFEVLDLSKDERFNQLGFIAGPPNFRYYAGVPLRTRRGINIGSIYILDSKIRAPLTRNEKHFLGVMADNVIQHLEMSRDRKDRQRTFRMNQCLSAYVDPAIESTKRRRRYSDHSLSAETDSDTDSRRTTDGGERIEIIARAAELLREAMDIEEDGGGVLYLDTSLADAPTQQPSLEPGHSSESGAASGPAHHQESLSRQQRAGDTSAMTANRIQLSSLEAGKKRKGSTEILVHTYQPTKTAPEQPGCLPFTPEELLKLIKRYPRGRLVTYDQQGQELSDSSDNESVLNSRPRSKKRQERSAADSALFRAHFPEARQIMFTPIWDSTTSRSAACFVYNCSNYRNFTHQLEFLNCITFNNCVDTELLRLSNLKAAEQKNNFIGSISHELRSPLHGILASCEFLQDTTCTSFQQSLVKTAESCARTLLDTVNMVLDYSKINAFEKNKSGGASSDRTDSAQSSHRKAFQTDLNAQRNVDLATLTEEVVEGVATGHVFNDPQTQTADRDVTADGKSSGGPKSPRRPDVELIVEISEHDWIYWCEPGSIRRIVMNLVGNALKYTQTGFVHVKLDKQIDERELSDYGILTVTDSGQGISPSYLKDKLYRPFAQESNQAPGVGLGLSLVKSIVDNMGGHIDVVSTVGAGTKFTVKFPLTRKLSLDSKLDRVVEIVPSRAKTTTTNGVDSIRKNEALTDKPAIAIYWQDDGRATTEQQKASQLLFRTLTSYLNTWSTEPVKKWQEDSTADIIVVEDTALVDLLRRSPLLSTHGCRTMILVLRSTGTSTAKLGGSKHVEDICHPVGPQKLAKSLQACVDRSRAASLETTRVENITSATVHLSISVDQTPCEGPMREQETTKSTENHSHKIKAVPASTIPHNLLDAAHTTKTAAASDLSSPTRRILLVDDNAINLRLLQVGMKKRGYKSISSASDGLQAVTAYRTLLHSRPPGPPDMILMDLSMPVMNGFDATRKIREIEAEYNRTLGPGQAPLHSLIIALTGLASVRDQKEAYTAGVDAYVMKPVSFAKLATLLEDATVDGKGAVRENGSTGV
ncbi:hsp90-like protein [Stagonosporopsis vannaccii]|nr:hsp90-like protein [Stagonosporopsis vannaccii]